MARLRKIARLRRNPDALEAARRALVQQDDRVFTVETAAIFGRAAPLEVEIGAGKGDFIIARAAAHPERDFLAVEMAGNVCQMLAARAGGLRLGNLRVMRTDGRTLVNLLLPDRGVAAFHVYFPDPWPKERHAKHRLFSPFFVRSLARTLERGGQLCLATDVAARAREIFELLAAGGFVRVWDSAPGARASGFGRKYLGQGRPVFAATFAVPLAAERPGAPDWPALRHS